MRDSWYKTWWCDRWYTTKQVFTSTSHYYSTISLHMAIYINWGVALDPSKLVLTSNSFSTKAPSLELPKLKSMFLKASILLDTYRKALMMMMMIMYLMMIMVMITMMIFDDYDYDAGDWWWQQITMICRFIDVVVMLRYGTDTGTPSLHFTCTVSPSARWHSRLWKKWPFAE